MVLYCAAGSEERGESASARERWYMDIYGASVAPMRPSRYDGEARLDWSIKVHN